MNKRILILFMALLILLVSAACTPAQKDIYETYFEYMYMDPETGEFVDPDTFVPNIEDEDEDEEIKDDVQEIEKKPIVINVADYGAKGDGVTDDATAISNAVAALMQGGSGSKLVFGKNKTYYTADNNNASPKVLNFTSLSDNITIEGNGSTILCGGDLTYMSISNCNNFTVKNLNFNRKITAHFIGTIYAKNTEEGYVDVVSDRDIGFSEEEYIPMTGDHFAFIYKEGEASRSYCYMEKLATVNAAERKYRFYVKKDGALGTMDNFNKLENGSAIIIPTPYVGHYLQDSFNISGCSDLLLKDINVWNIPRFGFHINGNKGKLTFDNVDLVPPSDEKAIFVSWRDGFHCKNNWDAITWKNCDAVGLGDDIINISANMLYVNKVYVSKNAPLIGGKRYPDQISCTFPQTNGSYGTVEEGDTAVIYDVDTGKFIAKTTVKKVISKYENRYLLSEPIVGLKSGVNIRVYFDNHAAPNSQLIDCNFEGTLRFKGAGGVATNCKLKMYNMMMYPETNVEGPIPHDTIFRKCDFTGSWNSSLRISALSPVALWKDGNYRLENIVFENCKGLTRSLFQNDLNFNEKSVDYITITPALTN